MSLTWRLPTGRGLWITRRFSPPTAKETATVLSQPPQVFFDASPSVSGSTRKDGKGAVKKRSTSHAPTSSFVSGSGGGSSHHDGPSHQQHQHQHQQQQQHSQQHQHQRQHQGDMQHHGRNHAPAPNGHQHQHQHHHQPPQAQYAAQDQNPQQQQQQQQQRNHQVHQHQHQHQQQQQQPERRIVNGWEWFPGHGWYPASWADLQRQHPNQGFDMPNQQQQQQQQQQQHQRARAAREAQFRRRVGWINSVEDFAFLGCTVAFVWFVIPDLADQIYLGRGADALANRIVFERAVRKKNKKDRERAQSAGGVPGEEDGTELSGTTSSPSTSAAEGGAGGGSKGSSIATASGFSPYSPKPLGGGGPTKVAIKASDADEEGGAPVPVTKGEPGPPPMSIEIKGDDTGDAGRIEPKKK